jgi:hypothetical protein
MSITKPRPTHTQSNPAIPFGPAKMVHIMVVQGRKITPNIGQMSDLNAKSNRDRPTGNNQKITKPIRGPKSNNPKGKQHILSSLRLNFEIITQPRLNLLTLEEIRKKSQVFKPSH